MFKRRRLRSAVLRKGDKEIFGIFQIRQRDKSSNYCRMLKTETIHLT